MVNLLVVVVGRYLEESERLRWLLFVEEEKPKRVLAWEGGGDLGFGSFKGEVKGFKDLREDILMDR